MLQPFASPAYLLCAFASFASFAPAMPARFLFFVFFRIIKTHAFPLRPHTILRATHLMRSCDLRLLFGACTLHTLLSPFIHSAPCPSYDSFPPPPPPISSSKAARASSSHSRTFFFFFFPFVLVFFPIPLFALPPIHLSCAAPLCSHLPSRVRLFLFLHTPRNPLVTYKV